MKKKICPYPGLRPFTESESVFFKGRDLHVKQIINQLEEKKITIITGASGDGKSSLVYAGIIPNARAGFFKAEHNNWIIADFRPELSPLKNLAKSLADNLKLDYEFVEKELSYGFSALVRIFKASEYYHDFNDENTKNTDEKTLKKLKQKASNLFILADQFEEFFTNTENFVNNKPSINAYTTVNVLLETARIAKKQNLPIYITVTMRSDYISQCVSFAGLPEYIGYSQFFIPRLKRNELQQIIEEPALLTGGKISKNVTEKLINDLPNNFDQLPILQHVLNQLWKYADNGEEEINMIHLAKTGGIPIRFLDEKAKEEFNLWFENLDEYAKKFYKNPALKNVLNTHANILYEIAFDYFNKNIEWAEKNITNEDCLLILKTAFQGLTKIDEGRAVRHRMTLKEITHVINKSHINYALVCGVLNIFRLPENTFVRPFIETGNIETEYLSVETVLDITHEALIRNWDNLKAWEQEELENLANLKDIKIQLKRWLDKNKTKDYMLSVGQLIHFEEWYERRRPNKYWIAKYEKSSLSKSKKLLEAEKLNNNILLFLTKSRERIDASLKRKKRNRRILFIAALIIIIVLSGILYFALLEKNKAEAQTKIAKEQTEIAENQTKIANQQKIKAENATLLAKKEKERAEENEKKALNSKLLSDKAKAEAQRLKLIADKKSALAKAEAKRAGDEKKEAEKQRLIAENQKQKANEASENAKKLSFLALAQSLALKSKKKYNDNQLNLLLANQAFEFNKENGGKKNDPIIYDALRFAISNAGKSNIMEIPKGNYKNFNLENNEKSTLISISGSINIYNTKNQKNIKEIDDFKTKIPLNKAFFLSDTKLIFALENKTVKFINKKTGKIITLPEYNYITDCEVFSQNIFFVADRNKNIKIWNTESNPVVENIINFNSRVNDIIYSQKTNKLFAACNNGELIVVDLKTMKKNIIAKRKGRITSISISPENIIAAGYSSGIVEQYSTENNYKTVSQKYVSNAGIRKLVYGKTSELLIVSCNDKKINIYSSGNINENPIVLIDQNQNTKSIAIHENEKLFVIYNDNTLREYELLTENYAKKVKSLIKRDFTSSEWDNYVGVKL